jgi:hypothetical protein
VTENKISDRKEGDGKEALKVTEDKVTDQNETYRIPNCI